jgi:hypothetical protein
MKTVSPAGWSVRVADVQAHQFAAPQRRGEPDQQQGAVAQRAQGGRFRRPVRRGRPRARGGLRCGREGLGVQPGADDGELSGDQGGFGGRSGAVFAAQPGHGAADQLVTAGGGMSAAAVRHGDRGQPAQQILVGGYVQRHGVRGAPAAGTGRARWPTR